MVTKRLSQGNRLEELDSLKGIGAIVIALIRHFRGFWWPGSSSLFYKVPVLWQYAVHGEWFVELFYMLSGFAMYLGQRQIVENVRARGGGVSPYLRRRILRLYPAMWIVIAIAYVEQGIIRFMTGEFWVTGSLDFVHLLYAFMGIEHWLDCADTVIPALWFIGPLMMCYILFYALTTWKARRDLSWVVYALPVIVGAFLSGTDWSFAFLNQRMGRGLFAFFLGVLLRIAMDTMEKRKDTRKLEHQICKVMLAILIFIGITYFFNRYIEKKYQIAYNICGDMRLLHTLILFPVLIFLSLKWRPLQKILKLRPLVFLGKIAFCIYLLHEPLYYLIHIIQIGFGLLLDTTTVSFYALVSISLILLSSLFWFFLEQPLTKYFSKKLM